MCCSDGEPEETKQSAIQYQPMNKSFGLGNESWAGFCCCCDGVKVVEERCCRAGDC